MKQGRLILLSAPSGTGKGTVVAQLMRMRTDLDLSISWTTRAPRPGDVEGETYFFKSEEAFQALIDQGGFIEFAGVYGKHYGTPRAYVRQQLARGRHVLLEIDTQGALQVMRNEPEVVSVFLLPPSMQELHRRLSGRGTESPEKVAQRFAFAYEELKQAEKYRYCIINDDVASAARKVSAIIDAADCEAPLLRGHIQQLQEETVL
jgi:guanylate kinase